MLRKGKKKSNENARVKHRVFCPCAGKMKLLFETREKAQRYISFNADTIREQTGYSPSRTYFCRGCGGWHVTSKDRITDDKE